MTRRRHAIFANLAAKGAAFAIIAGCAACVSTEEPIPNQELQSSAGYQARFDRASGSPVKGGIGVSPAGSGEDSSIAPLIVRGNSGRLRGIHDDKSAGDEEGGRTLNFDNAEIRDVIKVVLGDMLNLNYAIDPAVQGTLTLNTTKPLGRASVLPALEEALKLSGVALVSSAAGFQVVPLQSAAQRSTLGVAGSNSLQAGYQVRIVPLRYVATSDIQRVLEPLVTPGTVVQVDPKASFIALAGTSSEIERAEKAIALFDVDRLRGQSFGLFPLKYTSATEVAENLSHIVGKDGALSGVVRVAAITNLNSILVVSKQVSYIEQIRPWIARFDRGRDVIKPRLFVYHVQNGRAKDMAAVLNRVFPSGRSGSGASAGNEDSQLNNEAPGPDIPSRASSSRSVGNSSTLNDVAFNSDAVAASAASGQPLSYPRSASRTVESPQGTNGAGASTTGTTPSGSSSSDIRITADETNNSLLIVTTPNTYAKIESALAQLDVVPLQVLLEASIAEVDVTDQFRYGVQASFQNGGFSALSSKVAAANIQPSTGGLSLAYTNSRISAVLDLLSTYTKVRVISAPKLMVLNNRTASLQVGDQVPVATSSAVSTLTSNAPTVNTIQLYDTGIILKVTPRVNQSGLVLMDLSQEVSASVPTSTSTLNSPTIQQRRVSTSIAVQDGQTIAIGGLLRDNRSRDRTGVPGLKDIPVVGVLFGTTNDQVNRTELMVLITPTVIRNGKDADAATDELRAKLPMIKSLYVQNKR